MVNNLFILVIPNHLHMKTSFLVIITLLFSITITAQTDTYTVNGTSYELKKEVEGTLTLLWNTIDRDYRYFVEKDGVITELTNTKKDGKYQEEYKTSLASLTSGSNLSTKKVNLTLGSLRNFFNTYNSKVDSTYEANSFMTKPEFRLGGFLGITNSVFTSNPNNRTNLQLGAEFEILDPKSLPRHAAIVQYKQTLSNDNYDYSAAQFSLNYRYKFIKLPKVDFYINTKLITYTSFTTEVIQDGSSIIEADSGSNFQAPLLFGLGADIPIGKGFLFIQYQDAVGVFIENNGEFPTDVSAGYKFTF